MDDFFATVEHRWPPRRPDYHWHVLFDSALTRAAWFEPYRDLTHAHANLAPVAPEWYHLTLLHSAPVEELSDQAISDITDLVRQRCAAIRPFEITIDRPNIGTVAIECPGRQGAATHQLWETVAAATKQVTGDRFATLPEPGRYYPHTSLAYATGNLDHRPLKVWMSDSDLEPVTFPVPRIHLVAQQHDRRHITWEHVLEIPLGADS